MDKIPFSIYDFFGYLASGFLILGATDYAFNSGWLDKKEIGIGFGVLWIVIAYIFGHILANLSGHFLEAKMVRQILRCPEETLFADQPPSGWKRHIFPGYYNSLPIETRNRVIQKAIAKAQISVPGRALYFHCFGIVKRDEAARGRLNTFLNLYGFCRNVSLASIVAGGILVVGFLADWGYERKLDTEKIWWAVVALGVAIGLFYRYLKFYRHYTVEVFITYAETE